METWKTIPFEENYEVSDEGRVRNKETKHIKSLRKDRYGYKRVTLYPSGKTWTLHRVVLLTFKPKGCLEQVNHINGDKEDNRLCNLEWCTVSHNSRHRDTVLQSKWKGQLNPRSKLSKDNVYDIKYSYTGVSNKEVASYYGVNSEQVRRIRKGERWPHI